MAGECAALRATFARKWLRSLRGLDDNTQNVIMGQQADFQKRELDVAVLPLTDYLQLTF